MVEGEVYVQHVLGDFQFVGELLEVALAPPVGLVECGGVDEEAHGVAVGTGFLLLVKVAVAGGLVAIVRVAELMGEGGAVLLDTHSASGADGVGCVVVAPLNPAVMAGEGYA